MKKYLRDIFLIASMLVMGCVAVYADDNVDARPMAVVEQPAHIVKPGSHCVEISIADGDSHTVVVYALTGQVVKQMDVSGSDNAIDLAPGYYIVRIDGQSKRVVVK